MENKYQNGKIYKLVSVTKPELVYYGSTIRSLSRRMSGHLSKYTCGGCPASKELFEAGDVEIHLVELFPCNSRKELEKKEGEYILANECVNKNIAGRTVKEYYETNKEKITNYQIEYRKVNREKMNEKANAYYHANKEKRNEKLKEKMSCECGSNFTKAGLYQHRRTKKHINFIK